MIEKQLEDIESENQQLYRNEERSKRLVQEIKELKSHNQILAKEGSYGDSKISDLQKTIQTLENEVRVSNRNNSELQEQIQKMSV